MFKVDQVDHVELFVPDRYEAAAWYERVLGLRVVREAERWAIEGGPLMISSDRGNTKLALFEGQPVDGPPQAAFRRVAFRVNAEGFADFLRRLPEMQLVDSRRKAVSTQSVVDHQLAYSIYFSDPYGHQLEVTTYDYDETTASLEGLKA
jgi:catechol 2,3-dioxygenase-like lactoylglutathione lyase family enzyme